MKKQGETEANPRFKQLSAQLLAIQKAQTLRTAQQQQPPQPPAQARQPDGQPAQPGPSGLQGSPVVAQRPQENGQPNGFLI
jgi:hypothetical protein